MATNQLHYGRTRRIAVDSGITSGDPVLIGCLTGVAVDDRDSDGNATVDFGVPMLSSDLSVEAVNDAGNSAVAVGDELFITTTDSPQITKKASGNSFGAAIEAINSGSTDTIEVMVLPGAGSGTADILAGVVDTSELAAAAVTLAKMDDLARGSLISGQTASNRPTALDAKTSGQVLVGDGTDLASVAVSGDATLAADGTLSLADDSVGKAEFAGSINKVTLVAGGAAGDHTVTGIASGDEIVFVGHFSTAAAIATLADLTSEFSVASADTINNVGGTDTTNDQLMVIWNDLT